MKKVLIVTDLSFPGSAMASRLLTFAKMFKDLGYNVHIIAGKSDKKNIKCDVIVEESDYSYEIVYSKRNARLQSYIGNENLVKRLDAYLKDNDVDLVFTTSLNALFNKVFKVVKKHNKKYLLEQCEWYDPSSFIFGRLDPRYMRFLRNMKRNYKKVDGVVAISRLLEDYFKSLGVKTVRIPSIADVKNKPVNELVDNKKINLVFTGNTSNSKELIKPVLEALASKKEFLDRIMLNLYGSSRDEIIKNIGDNYLLDKVEKNVSFFGRIPQQEVENVLLNSNYQIFIRPYRKSSNAGFPTKLCESMSVGTPCITNDTGDISMVLKNNINGYLCGGNDAASIACVFDKIVLCSKDQNVSMRKESRESALSFFDYRNYIDVIKELL